MPEGWETYSCKLCGSNAWGFSHLDNPVAIFLMADHMDSKNETREKLVYCFIVVGSDSRAEEILLFYLNISVLIIKGRYFKFSIFKAFNSANDI